MALARFEHEWKALEATVSRISVLVPTRNRPDNVRRLLDSAYRTSALPPEFAFYVDTDDPTTHLTMAVGAEYGARFILGSRIVLSEMWNELAKIATHDIFMHCGDDIIFRSHHWDQRVVNEFDQHPDKLILVHGDDGYQRERLATHGFYHREWVNVLGRLVPPYFSSDYNDLWNTEVADMVGRRVYLPDVLTEHMHPSAGKGELDQTHLERLERHQRDDVAALYAALAHERVADAAKLRRAITEGRIGA